jgi:transketolase
MTRLPPVALERAAAQIRRDVIVQTAVARSGHPGGALGIADILAVLYFRVLRHDPGRPEWADRDRFVLSNGHCCVALYSALARTGYFPAEELLTFRTLGSRLQGHPARVDLAGMETSAGPLGQGLSIAGGIAMALALRRSSARVYCLVGDGELQEGQIWEATMTAAHHRLSGLCAIISENGLQIDGRTTVVKGVEPIAERFAAFGWKTVVVDGHDLEVSFELYALAPPIQNYIHLGAPCTLLTVMFEDPAKLEMAELMGLTGASVRALIGRVSVLVKPGDGGYNPAAAREVL